MVETPPTITVTSSKLRNLYTLTATLNNLQPNTKLSGSVIDVRDCSSNVFGLFVKLVSGSATSLGTSGSGVYVDWSPNAVDWNATSGSSDNFSFTTMNVWNYRALTGSWPFCRVVIESSTGSAISGSIMFFGR